MSAESREKSDSGVVEPAYRSDLCTIYSGDARLVLPHLAKESIDCVATDPPYGVGWQSNTRKEKFDRIGGDATEGEARALLDAVTPDLVRVTRRSRHLYTFGLPMEHELLAVKAELTWDKGRLGSGDLSLPWSVSTEPVFFHVRAADRCNAAKGAGGLAARLRRGSVISVRRLSATQVQRHPTEKPVAVMRQIIESSTCLGESVLDPFMGCGSTLVAALLEGRTAIGVEERTAYVETAIERVQTVERWLEKVGAA